MRNGAASENVPGSSPRRLAGAAGIMMASLLMSRILGLVREAVISGKLGQGAESDIYMAAFLLPDTLFFLIAGGALSSAFIPVFTELVARGDDDGASALFSTVATVMFAVVSAFIVAGFVFAEPMVRLLAYGYEPGLVRRIVPLTRIVLPAQLCFFIGGLLMGAQQARGRFFLPGMGPNVYNIGIIAGGVFLADRLGAAGLCWGALTGAVIGNFMLQAWGAYKQGLRYRPNLNWRDPNALRVWKLMLPVILGLALPQVSILLNRVFASTLGEGPMSALTRANVLMQAPLGIFGHSLSIAVFPTLSAQAALADWNGLRQTIGLGLRFIGFLTIPATAMLIALGTPITAVLLQHGRFTAEDTAMTAQGLSFYAIGLAAWSAQSLLARTFYAMQDTRTPIIIGTAVTMVFIPLNFLFMGTFRMGFGGLALATSVAATLNAGIMLVVLRGRVGQLGLRRIGDTTLRMGLASCAAGVVAWGAARLISGLVVVGPAAIGAKVSALTVLIGGGGSGIAVYLLAARLLGVAELGELAGMLRRRRRSGGSDAAE